ncbi:MAG: CbrC family protein [Coprobacillus sp.]
MKDIKFKYHPHLLQDQILVKGKGICQCCGQEVNEYIPTMYCVEDIDCICLECVENGKAAEKFDGSFIQDAEKILSQDKRDELFKRTPGYVSWQGEYWLTCCDDYCAYIGSVGTKELEEMGIADEVFKEYDERDEYEDAREYLVKDGMMAGYLFQCLHCGKYHLWVDAD